MVFSSVVFLFLFLPVVLLTYFVSERILVRNAILLIASLIFYAWGEHYYVFLMLISISTNWVIGRFLNRDNPTPTFRKKVLTAGVILNLIPLAFFKYANFFVDSLNTLIVPIGITPIELAPIHLPIGISFYTFQAISYIVDVFRNDAKAQPSFNKVALYIALFPQLIAGPIVRFESVANALNKRTSREGDIVEGMVRFVNGLGKKVLIANPIGAVADQVFSLPIENISTELAWLGIVAYTMQIFFDFSGYSDMAIGLGRIFGFRFPENFNYPYIANSIQDFWRRWHMSLSSWFRDYLYIPLGGNKRGMRRTYVNLFIVFFLCGLWHGASWTFVIWGLFHGTFLVIERMRFGQFLKRLPRFIRHAYALLIVMIGWVFFRSETIDFAFDYLHRLFIYKDITYMNGFLYNALNPIFYSALIVACVLSTPIIKNSKAQILNKLKNLDNHYERYAIVLGISRSIWLIVMFTLVTTQLLSSDYNPFLYFRF